MAAINAAASSGRPSVINPPGGMRGGVSPTATYDEFVDDWDLFESYCKSLPNLDEIIEQFKEISDELAEPMFEEWEKDDCESTWYCLT